MHFDCYQTVNLSYWYRFKKAKYRVWRSRKAFLLVQVIDNSWKKSSANKMAAVVIMFRVLWENFVHSLSVLEKVFTESKSKSFSRSKIRQIFSVLTSFSCCGVARISKKESFVLLDLYILVMNDEGLFVDLVIWQLELCFYDCQQKGPFKQSSNCLLHAIMRTEMYLLLYFQVFILRGV